MLPILQHLIMAKKRIKNILFDLGGVLFHIDYQRTIDAFKSLGEADFERLFTQHQQNSLFDSFETGKISSKKFIETLQLSLPNCRNEVVVKAWNAMLLGLPAKHLLLLEELSKKYRLFLLSNANKIHINFVNNHLSQKHNIESIDGYFEKAYYSHLIGMRKPHPSTFRWVLNNAGIKAGETLFIEDTRQHIVGAKEAGLQTLHVKSNADLFTFFPDIVR